MKTDKIMLACGGGGEEMNELINDVIFKIFDNEILRRGDDSAVLDFAEFLPNFKNLAFSTDSFVVSPLIFEGGDIGKLAVCGTINDLAMVGARAIYLSCALIIEEGFSLSKLKKILESMKNTAEDAGVKIICGDTKVVPKGACDGLFINTSGIALAKHKAGLSRLKAGAKILLSGDIGAHGATLMASRHNMQSKLKSDCKCLHNIVFELLDAKIDVLCMRDATRGGLSAVLNEWVNASNKSIKIYESKIAISDEVMGICELLGFEAYELANEGTFILALDEKDENKALEILKKHNQHAACIGQILNENPVLKNKACVILENAYGASRFLQAPKGELLPRIC